MPTGIDTFNYPKTLQSLVDGVKGTGAGADTKIKFLRRIPIDPMTRTREWGLRSMQDDPKSKSWGGQNVFDVYTKSDAKDAEWDTLCRLVITSPFHPAAVSVSPSSK